MSTLSFDELAQELSTKAKGLGNLGVRLKFKFQDLGVIHIDATSSEPVVTRDESLPADLTISAPLNVWLGLRAKTLAPHVAAMTNQLTIEGDLNRGMALAPRIMAVL